MSKLSLPLGARGWTAVLLAAFGLVSVVPGRGDEPAKLQPATVKELQDKYRADRAAAEKAGLDKVFSPEWFSRAGDLAKSGDAALAAGRLLEAVDNFRRARWEIPGLPADFPPHVARIFGDSRLPHTHWVLCVAFSRDSKLFASISDDRAVRVWDIKGQIVAGLQPHAANIYGVAFSPDSKLIATCGADNTAKIHDIEAGSEKQRFEGHKGAVTCLAFSKE